MKLIYLILKLDSYLIVYYDSLFVFIKCKERKVVHVC